MGPDFPSNSHSTKGPKKEKVERVISGEAVRRRKPLGKQFKETFVGGSWRGAISGAVFDVLIPSARDMMFEAFQDGMHRLIFGDSKRRSSYGRGGPMGHFDYSGISRGNRYSRDTGPPPEPRMSRRGRARHDFDEIVLATRAEATEVLDALFELSSKWDEVSVADLYLLIGEEPNHVDETWGWRSLEGADVMKVRGGWLLDLPDPQPLK